MKEDDSQLALDDHSLAWAVCFEVSLGLLALFCGYLTNVWPADRLSWPLTAPPVLIGLASAFPPLAIVLALRRLPWSILRELSDLVDEKLAPMFQSLNLAELAILSLAAGWGEELLFRGLIQAELSANINVFVGILVASVLFGLVHFLSLAYFLMAFGISIYFGWLFWHFDSLWVPILGHAAYDFLMLLILRRNLPPGEETDEAASQEPLPE